MRHIRADYILPRLLVFLGMIFLCSCSPSTPTTPAITHDVSVVGSLIQDRMFHTATLLPSGKVLVAGGESFEYSGLTQMAPVAEVFDPGTGKATAAGTMVHPRIWHTATLLPDGRVAIIGGSDNSVYPNTEFLDVEIWDPVTQTFQVAGQILKARVGHLAFLRPDGKILIVGGWGVSDFDSVMDAYTEVFDPATGVTTQGFTLTEVRQWPGAAVLPSGDLVLVNGYNPIGGINFRNYVEVYPQALSPQGATTCTRYSLPDEGSRDTGVTLDQQGRVIIAGGYNSGYGVEGGALDFLQTFDPKTGTTVAVGKMIIGRDRFACVTLNDGLIAFIGGDTNSPDAASMVSDSIEVRETVNFTSHLLATKMVHPRSGLTATRMPDGSYLLIGGRYWTIINNDTFKTVSEVERLR